MLTVDERLHRILDRGRGVAHRRELLGAGDRGVLDTAYRRGELIRLHPQVYAAPDAVRDPWLRWRAALLYAGPRAAVSHTSALRLWGLLDDRPPKPGESLHLTVPGCFRRRSADGVVLHRRDGFDARRDGIVRGLFPVTDVELSIIQSWSMARDDTRRFPVIRAVAERLTTPERLFGMIAATPNLPGRAELMSLNHLLATGCRSELELWGHAHVFSGPGLPPLRWQWPVLIGRRRIYLDVYAEAERVNFELDGARWHASPEQRERDLRRDAALAALGILVVRFTHRRITREPANVRRQAISILESRRAMSNLR